MNNNLSGLFITETKDNVKLVSEYKPTKTYTINSSDMKSFEDLDFIEQLAMYCAVNNIPEEVFDEVEKKYIQFTRKSKLQKIINK